MRQGSESPPMRCPCPKPKKLLACDPGLLQARSSRLRPRESTHEKTTHDVMRIVSSAAAQVHLHLFTMASHPQLPIFIFTKIFTTSLAISLASSCKSASPGAFFLQRLPAPGSRLPCFDPPPSRLVSRKSACLLRIWEGVGEALGCFLCLPCTPTRGLRCLLSLGFVCHGVDRIW